MQSGTNGSAKVERDILNRSEIMKRVGQKDTAPEFALRRALHAHGLRYRTNYRVEGIRIDVAFTRARVAVFVDGCFWHGCPKHGTIPKSNQAYWKPKLAQNKKRDQAQTAKLVAADWQVIRIWEHECRPVSEDVIDRIMRKLRAG